MHPIALDALNATSSIEYTHNYTMSIINMRNTFNFIQSHTYVRVYIYLKLNKGVSNVYSVTFIRRRKDHDAEEDDNN